MPTALDLTYPSITAQLKQHTVQGRTESRAFLAWFLEHYYRLDADQARDCVCDGPDDKGVDGIYVDDNLESIDVFQSRLFKNNLKTLGDTDLKEFLGTLSQFESPEKIDLLATTTGNKELSSLITSEELSKKLSHGYSVKGIFVTNVLGDNNAERFINSQPQISLYDSGRLTTLYVPLGPTGPMTKPAKFNINPSGCANYKINGIRVFLASLKASELINLDGIASGALFAWNVRQSLGRTKVNKEIGVSVHDPHEHKNFLLYHNGLTILSNSVKKRSKSITLTGYTVGGCFKVS